MIYGNKRLALLGLMLLLWRLSASAEVGRPESLPSPGTTPADESASGICFAGKGYFLRSDFDSIPPVPSDGSGLPFHRLDTVLTIAGISSGISVHLYIPQQRKPGGVRYPVIYLPLPEALSDRQGCLDSIMAGCCSQSLCVAFTWPDSMAGIGSVRADSTASALTMGLKAFIDKRHPTYAEPKHTTLAALGQSANELLRLMLLNPEVFGNGIFFLENARLSADDERLLQRQAPAFSGKFCFYLAGDPALFNETSWLDKFGLLSDGIIYAVRVSSGATGNCFWKNHLPFAYAWLMADGPNKLVNSGD